MTHRNFKFLLQPPFSLCLYKQFWEAPPFCRKSPAFMPLCCSPLLCGWVCLEMMKKLPETGVLGGRERVSGKHQEKLFPPTLPDGAFSKASVLKCSNCSFYVCRLSETILELKWTFIYSLRYQAHYMWQKNQF